MNFMSIPQLAQNANRLREIITILARYGLADWVSRLDNDFVKGLYRVTHRAALDKFSTEQRIRLTLTDLGTTFMKLGQMLSTRGDLIGIKLAEELSSLQANAPADPPRAVHDIIQQELGKPISELFAAFEDTPIASASIGQVHRARLPSGQVVAVKVQHPDIERKIRIDLEILMGLAELAEKHLPELRHYRPRATVAEFQRTIIRELDFGREERNLEQFTTNFLADPTVRFPTPYPELSTGRVLTMDFIDGIFLSDTVKLREQDHDLEELARRGASIFLEMIFRDGFFHADPHPGNILVLPGGIIGLIDGGQVGRLDDNLREDIEDVLVAVVARDAAALTAIITRVGAIPPELDRAGLSNDVTDFLAYYGSRPLDQLNLGAALSEVTEIIRRYHIVLPGGIAVLLKVLVMLEGTSRLLNPKFNMIELMRPYQQKLFWRRMSPARHFQKLRRIYQEWELLGVVFPQGLREVLQQVQGGKFVVHLDHKGLEPSVNRLVFGMLTSALFLGSALIWSVKAPPLLWDVSIIGVVGCLASLGLGIRLLWAIRQSGRLGRKSDQN
jgi:ubiquinone biosynthesis protein